MGSGQQYVKPPSSDTCSDKNPLFIIVDVFCLYSILRKLTNKGEIPIFSIVLYKKFLSTLSKAFSLDPFPIGIVGCFFVFYAIISLVRTRLLNNVLFEIEQFCFSDII